MISLSSGSFPEVGPIFEDYAAVNGLCSRVEFRPGSFFDAPIPQADVVMMGHILHDWNLEEKKLIIRKAYEAIPQGGALIVYESIIDDDRSQNSFGLLMSLNMLIETPAASTTPPPTAWAGWRRRASARPASSTSSARNPWSLASSSLPPQPRCALISRRAQRSH